MLAISISAKYHLSIPLFILQICIDLLYEIEKKYYIIFLVTWFIAVKNRRQKSVCTGLPF